MIRGIYSSAAGMNVQLGRLDAVSNNLANIGVPGYKKDRIISVPFPQLLQLSMLQPTDVAGFARREVIGTTNQGVAVQQVLTDYSQGNLRETGVATDFAITGNGFFTLTEPDGGDVYYTRNGNFQLDDEGYLINENGYRVMGENGPIQIYSLEKTSVDEFGRIMEDGEEIGSFSIAAFGDTTGLERVGGSLYRSNGPGPENDGAPGLVQKFLESANINLVEESVNMVNAARAYETGQKIIQAEDGMLDIAINKIGVVR